MDFLGMYQELTFGYGKHGEHGCCLPACRFRLWCGSCFNGQTWMNQVKASWHFTNVLKGGVDGWLLARMSWMEYDMHTTSSFGSPPASPLCPFADLPRRFRPPSLVGLFHSDRFHSPRPSIKHVSARHLKPVPKPNVQFPADRRRTHPTPAQSPVTRPSNHAPIRSDCPTARFDVLPTSRLTDRPSNQTASGEPWGRRWLATWTERWQRC